ncbi:MAG: hypothetical protein HC808_12535, partial [Candidatus Competibacteraceae bacterium]|nr:hypothetical protein [Candidatus Competibacteraceae bacterium]
VPIAARGSVKNVKEFIEKMKKEGITISEEEAKQVLQDTCLDTKQNKEKFEEIMKKVKELDPILKKLAAAKEL